MTSHSILVLANLTLILINYNAYLWNQLSFIESEFMRAVAFLTVENLRVIILNLPINIYESFVI